MKAYGVFEGGGARGVALVGAVRAAEKRRIEFTAVAGTSAGAIVAALLSAGYSGKEIFDSSGGAPTGILASDIVSDVMDSTEYERVQRYNSARAFFKVKRLPVWLSRPFGGLGSSMWRHLDIFAPLLIVALLFVAAALAVLDARIFLAFAGAVLVAWLIMYWRFGRLVRSIWIRAGATDTSKFKEWLNKLLCSKLELAPDTVVQFHHLSRVPLRIIAADISKGELAVFGQDPAMPVAQAVAASIAYPVFFRPLQINDSMFVDGGIVSNFPAWVLDDLRAGQEYPQPTFGFRLRPPGANPTPNHQFSAIGLSALFRKLLSTMLNSRTSLESRQINDYHQIMLRTHIGTLDFHRLAEEGKALVENGEQDAEAYFHENFGPQRTTAEMKFALSRAADRVQEITQAPNRLRAYLIQPNHLHYCRIIFSSFGEDEPDAGLTINLAFNSQATCILLREPVLMRIAELAPVERSRPATRVLHALRPSNIVHVYSIPIFEDPANWLKSDPLTRDVPIAALCLDFTGVDDDLPDDRLLLDPAIEDYLAGIAQVMGEYWRSIVLIKIEEPTAAANSPSGDWVSTRNAPGFYVSNRKVRAPLHEDRQLDLDNLVLSMKRSVPAQTI